MKQKPKVIVMLGPQGSGKGTQAAFLSKKLGYPAFSAGQLYRDEVKKGTALGHEAKKIMEKGLFMPSETTNRLMRTYLTPARCRRGVILDGYPRSVAQVRANDKFCSPDLVLYIKLTDVEAVNRLSLRARLEGRTDDKPAAIRKRLRHFHREVMPAIRLYQKRGIMREIDGSKNIPQVWKQIQRVVF